MEEIREGEAEELEFALKEIVWAKITGYPWWPARVTQLPSALSPAYRVDFFNDHTHAFLPASKIGKYEEIRGHIDLHRHINKGLRKAIGQADKQWGEQGSSCAPSVVSQPSVEEPSAKQKILLQSPQAPSTHLQENFNQPPEPESLPHQIPQPQSSRESQMQPTAPHLAYSRQQRLNFVNNLLKKYRLVTIPKIAEASSAIRSVSKPVLTPTNRRRVSSVRKSENRTKMIKKFPYQQQNLSHLLTRKIFTVLRDKEGLQVAQRREISLSLAREVLGEGGIDEINRLFKWIMISPATTIANFYDKWNAMQGSKEKPSNMTNQE